MGLVEPQRGLSMGLTGATVATRYVGGTASAAPITGTFRVGDFVVTAAGTVFVCTVAGSPGTWTQVGSGGSLPDPITTDVTIAPTDAESEDDALRINPASFDSAGLHVTAGGDDEYGGTIATLADSEDQQVLNVTSGGQVVATMYPDFGEFRVETDQSVNVIQAFNAAAVSKLGFFNASPVAQPTVNNATAADIIAALAALGLIIDGT